MGGAAAAGGRRLPERTAQGPWWQGVQPCALAPPGPHPPPCHARTPPPHHPQSSAPFCTAAPALPGSRPRPPAPAQTSPPARDRNSSRRARWRRRGSPGTPPPGQTWEGVGVLEGVGGVGALCTLRTRWQLLAGHAAAHWGPASPSPGVLTRVCLRQQLPILHDLCLLLQQGDRLLRDFGGEGGGRDMGAMRVSGGGRGGVAPVAWTCTPAPGVCSTPGPCAGPGVRAAAGSRRCPHGSTWAAAGCL